jgi:hypothetical protein
VAVSEAVQNTNGVFDDDDDEDDDDDDDDEDDEDDDDGDDEDEDDVDEDEEDDVDDDDDDDDDDDEDDDDDDLGYKIAELEARELAWPPISKPPAERSRAVSRIVPKAASAATKLR